MEATSIGKQPDRIFASAAMIVFAVFLMALQDAIIKVASSGLTLWQIYVLRSSLALPVLLVAGIGSAATLRSALGFWALFRAVLLMLMYVSLYASIRVLPLATMAAGFYTGPLFIALLSGLLIGEPVRRNQWLALAIGFAGVLLVLRPGAGSFTGYVLLPVLSGFLYALAAVLTRGRCQDTSPVTLAISLNIVLLAAGLLATLVLAVSAPSLAAADPFLFGRWAVMELSDWALVATLAVLIVGIGLGLAGAYRSAPPAIIASFDYSYLVFSTVFGVLMFAEVPDLQTVSGMALIAGAGFLTLR